MKSAHQMNDEEIALELKEIYELLRGLTHRKNELIRELGKRGPTNETHPPQEDDESW